MTTDEFSHLADAWWAALKPEAERLFADGVPHDQCLRIAIQISDAKALGGLRSQRALSPGLVIPRRN